MPCFSNVCHLQINGDHITDCAHLRFNNTPAQPYTPVDMVMMCVIVHAADSAQSVHFWTMHTPVYACTRTSTSVQTSGGVGSRGGCRCTVMSTMPAYDCGKPGTATEAWGEGQFRCIGDRLCSRHT